MDLREIAAAYQSIYLKEEVEDNILLEDLSQDEVDDLVEEIIDELLEEGFSLEQIEEGFEDYISEESEVLNEAKKQKGFMASQREKLAAQRAQKKDEGSSAAAASAARAAKVEADKAAAVVRPSEKIAASAKKAVETRKALPPKGGTSAGSAKAVTQRGATRHKQAVNTAATVAGAFMKTLDASAKAAKSDKRRKDAEEKKATAAKGSTNVGPATPVSGTKVKGALPATRTVTKGEQKRKDAQAKLDTAAKGTTNVGPAIPNRTKGGAIVKRNETIGPKTEVKKGVKKAIEYRLSKKDLKRANRRDDTSAAPKSKTDRVKDAASAVRVGARNLKKKAGKALGKLAAKLSEEGGELDSFDTVVAYLIDEEIASTFEEANAMMTKLSAETISEIHESQMTYITEISAQLALTASQKADEVRRKAALAGDRETAAKKAAQASRIYKGVGLRRAKERKEGN